MKKKIIPALLLSLALLAFAGCAKTDAAKEVIELIKTVSANVTKESGEELASVRHEYNLLSEKEKKQVNNLSRLEKAEALYESISTMNEDIAAILRESSASFSSAAFAPTAMLARAQEIKEDYKDLSDDAQAEIEGVESLDEAIEKLQACIDSAEKVAKVYAQAFLSLHDKAEVTGVYCIQQIRDEGELCYFFALTYQEGGEEKRVYSNARFRESIAVSDIVSNAESAFAEKPAGDGYDAIANGNVTLDLKNVL